jgi:CRP-like cAMP-binding protein
MEHARGDRDPAFALAGLGLVESGRACAPALADAPVLTLVAGRRLACRPGAPVTAIPLSGLLQATQAGATARHGPGALIGLRQTILGASEDGGVEAAQDSVVLLLDRARLSRLAGLSPRFAQRIAHTLLAPLSSTAPIRHAAGFDDAIPPRRFVVLARLANREAVALVHGARAAERAMHELNEAIRQSIRPADLLAGLAEGECLIGVEGDMLAAQVVARRVLSRAARVVVFGDMHVPLPHLDVAVGIAAAATDEPLQAAAERARASLAGVSRASGETGHALA